MKLFIYKGLRCEKSKECNKLNRTKCELYVNWVLSAQVKRRLKRLFFVIYLYLIDLCENVNLKRPLRDAQVDNIAREIVAEYYSLTVADIHVIFRKAKTGEYGEFYESLDMPKVMSWFREYFADRCATGASMSVSSQFQDKGGNMTPERMTKHFVKLEKQLKKGNK